MNYEIFMRCKKSDRVAQRSLYEEFAGKLYVICKRYLKNEEDAEEVLADTFYIVFTKISQLQSFEAFEAWAKKIAVNQCLQFLRKKEKLQISIEDISEKRYSEPANFSFEKDILALLNLLPEGCRTIFNLFAIEGYPHKEIAEMLSISEGTSKSQLNFARKKLQELLQFQNA